MSSALPCGRPSTTSNSTTSASWRCAISCACTPPMLPPPMSEIFFFRFAISLNSSAHVLDDGSPELRALEQRPSVHQPVEIVGHALLRDGLGDAVLDQAGNLAPAHVVEHHDTRQDHRRRVDLVLVGVL